MADSPSFVNLMDRVRGGDAVAAEALVRQYETAVRVAVRARLTEPALARYFDSLDVCQSVFKSFFRRAARHYDVRDPGQLVRLLVGMARRKLARYVRRYRRIGQDYRRVQDDSGRLIRQHPDPRPSPDRQAADHDLFAGVYRRLSPEERALADAWAGGEGWAEIAARLGGTPEGRRKQFTRALDRVVHELGLSDDEPAV